jgi:hypothetical protein
LAKAACECIVPVAVAAVEDAFVATLLVDVAVKDDTALECDADDPSGLETELAVASGLRDCEGKREAATVVAP